MGKLRIRFPVRVVRVKTGAAQIWEAQRVSALGLGGLMQQAGSVQVKMEIIKKKKGLCHSTGAGGWSQKGREDGLSSIKILVESTH